MKQRQTAIDIFLAGVESVKPDNLIRNYLSIKDNVLKIDKLAFNLAALGNIYVVGAGKASALMAKEMEAILGSRISNGHIVTKYDHAVPLKYIGCTEAGHPVPDENGIKGTEKILSIAQTAGEEDLLICLISGGGSALLTDVPYGCTLNDLKILNDLLLKSGASINEMNCIRKHLSNVKGGLLAKAASPARVVSLVLSDVIGDPLDVIASGPTAPDPTTFGDAIAIIRRYNLEDNIPQQILKVLREGYDNKRPETLKETSDIFLRTTNLIIGTNKLALKIAKEKAESLGYETQIVTNTLEGEVVDVVRHIVEMAKSAKQIKADGKICLLFAGEPTIKVSGSGLGGRNQHLALVAADLLKDRPDITVLSAGTDGTDGPTDAAGAVADSNTWDKANDLGLNIDEYIKNCDSYHFFKDEGGLIITGPTQTNVMDLIVVLIE